MIDIFLDENYEIVFNENGDFVPIEFNYDAQYQDLSIVMNIDAGHNKQFPTLGAAIYKSINGVENELFSSIISNAQQIGVDIKDIYIDTNKKIQILI
jgi:hypothetical protein